MNPRDARNLADLVEFVRRAEALVARGKDAYDGDEMLRYAAQMICVNLGGAAGRLSPALVAAHPQIRFGAMRRQRDLAAHRYDSVDPEIIWQTLAVEIPKDARLIAAMRA